MNRRILLGLVAAAAVLHGQPVFVTIKDSGNNGKMTATVQNTSSRTLTAFALTLDRTPTVGSPNHIVFYYDSVTNRSYPPLPPGASKTQALGGGSSPATSQMTFRAALFDDGSTFGDPSWSTRLVTNRQALEKHLTLAILKLQSYSQDTPLEAVVADFDGMQQQAKALPDKDESIIAQNVYSSVPRTLNLPQVGDSVPLSAQININSLLKKFLQQKQEIDAALATTP